MSGPGRGRGKGLIMRWFRWEERDEHPAYGRPIASSGEIERAFRDEREYLLWTVRVITGKTDDASQSIIDASQSTTKSTGVFLDWLSRWAHSATARAAVAAVRELLVNSAARYAAYSCSHPSHDVLTGDQIASLRQIDPTLITAELDPLARATLVLRGVQHDSIFDCALQINVPRRSVAGAYCRALQWSNERLRARATGIESHVPIGRSCTQLGAQS